MPRTSNSQDFNGRTVLLVEDQFLIRMDIQLMLEDRGIEVCSAGNLEGALKCIADHDFDLAILDVRLPDGEVFPAAELLCEIEVPIIFHSAHAEAERLAKTFPNAISLPKPAHEDALFRAIGNLLDSPRSQAAAE